jgi:hypothetical protein
MLARRVYTDAYSSFLTTEYKLRHEFVQKYTWAIPTEGALALLARYSPIVEMGAGTGLWASMLAARGADVVAFDAEPPNIVKNHWHDRTEIFFPVQPGTPEVLANFPDRSLFLCWPPYNTAMASECLDYYRGQHVLYIGEGKWGCTATDDFHETLENDFNMIEYTDIPQWNGIHDRVEAWRRK